MLIGDWDDNNGELFGSPVWVCEDADGEDVGKFVWGGNDNEVDSSLVCGGTTGNMIGLDDDGWELGVDDSCTVGWSVGSVSVVASSFGFGLDHW